MCWSKIFPSKEKAKPQIELLSISSHDALTEVTKEAKLKLLYPVLFDAGEIYHFTTAKDWAELFGWIYFDFKMPSFVSARCDCDDFAFLLKGLVSGYFQLNYFGVVLGNAPGGYHAWNIFRTEDGLMQFEPQTGQYFPLGERGYFPEWLLL